MRLTSVLLMVCLFTASLTTTRFAYGFGLYAKWDEQMNPGGSCFINLEVLEGTRMISFTSAVITFEHSFDANPRCEHYEQGAQLKTVSLSNARLIRFRKDAQPGIGQAPVEDKSFPLGTCNQFSVLLTSKLFSTPVAAFNNWPADIYQDAQDNEPDNYLFGIEFKCHMTHNCAGTAGEHCLCEPGTHYIEAMFRIQYANSAHCNRFVSFSFTSTITPAPSSSQLMLSGHANIVTDIEAWCEPVIFNYMEYSIFNCFCDELLHTHTIIYAYNIDWGNPGDPVNFQQTDECNWYSDMFITDCFGIEEFTEERNSSVTVVPYWAFFDPNYVPQYITDGSTWTKVE